MEQQETKHTPGAILAGQFTPFVTIGVHPKHLDEVMQALGNDIDREISKASNKEFMKRCLLELEDTESFIVNLINEGRPFMNKLYRIRVLISEAKAAIKEATE